MPAPKVATSQVAAAGGPAPKVAAAGATAPKLAGSQVLVAEAPAPKVAMPQVVAAGVQAPQIAMGAHEQKGVMGAHAPLLKVSAGARKPPANPNGQHLCRRHRPATAMLPPRAASRFPPHDLGLPVLGILRVPPPDSTGSPSQLEVVPPSQQEVVYLSVLPWWMQRRTPHVQRRAWPHVQGLAAWPVHQRERRQCCASDDGSPGDGADLHLAAAAGPDSS
jgi:hypothetical protein